MTDALQRSATRTATGYRVARAVDLRALEARLSDDRAFSAYALGHLEPELFALTEFWTADGTNGASGSATVMHSRALGYVTVTVGAPEAVHAILRLHPGHRAGYLSTGAPEHVEVIARTHEMAEPLTMQRMSVTAFGFADPGGPVRRLRGSDVARINALYAMDGAPSRYSAETIERAIYYGAMDGDRLVAVAGTHIVSPHQSIAVVGNVFTHPGYRGRGLATSVTGAVTRELLGRGCSEVALTVAPENTPAVAAYTRLGYRRGTPVVEARLQRRDIGIGPWWRRQRARRLGHSYGPGIEWVRDATSEEIR